MRWFLALSLAGAAHAFELSSLLPFLKPSSHPTPATAGPHTVAIIGAGAAGSSAAFWISKAKERYGLDIEVDVYDKESYIGGRSTVVYPYNDTSMNPIELGASIFVKVNKNLWRASEEFNLARKDFEDGDSEMGIWDGEKFLLTMGGNGFFSGWWSTVKVLWRYGYSSPTKTQTLVKQMIDRFVELYTPESPRWSTISDLADAFQWSDMVSQTTAEYLDSNGVSKRFSRELVEAATRVNYGQNLDEIHALEGFCSMAASGASGIRDGNYLIFENFLNRSGADVFLKTPVRSISRDGDSWAVQIDKGTVTYDSVIIAAPFHSTGISFPPSLSSQVPKQPYVRLHVTLLATTAPHPNPALFSLPSHYRVPTTILTSAEGIRNGGKAPEFNSLSYHGLVKDGVAPKEWVVKLFSEERLSDEWLNSLFDGQVGWVLRKEWDAYPKLPPTTTFPPVKLGNGMYYVNAFEPFISTMETETIAARNIVDLLLQEQLNSGICGPPRIESTEAGTQQPLKPATSGADFVLGFDC
ncbi:hypothetical protein JAAARDRAFT_37950 [Jaapia argillacea MUCL 33604]|uniref:Prenylcysteine lyase domain-containing protein n=1 Tax=Jaapia argillacea MUCL 33604 TaxID=933084 RepID=A0A067PU74_9AGAM|nr:hypothetical protein JAAARDRAFT_37950 [Jaapia argillacea MUCL 33604]